MNNNVRIIAGIRFEAVRELRPIPHWRLKLPSGVVLEDGTAGLKGKSKPKLWESLEDLYRRCGEERFIQEFG